MNPHHGGFTASDAHGEGSGTDRRARAVRFWNVRSRKQISDSEPDCVSKRTAVLMYALTYRTPGCGPDEYVQAVAPVATREICLAEQAATAAVLRGPSCGLLRAHVLPMTSVAMH